MLLGLPLCASTCGVRAFAGGQLFNACARKRPSFTMHRANLASASDITPESRCAGCSGSGSKLTPTEIDSYRPLVPEWVVSPDYNRISKRVKVRNFSSGLDYFAQIGAIADAEGHHPDLHLRSFQHIELELHTHTLGGLTPDDFIMAVKLDCIPVPAPKSRKNASRPTGEDIAAAKNLDSGM
jgi:4a-hydroxytetrahydrobiopterin dehydratase